MYWMKYAHKYAVYKRIFYVTTTTDRQLNVEYCTVWNNEELSMNIYFTHEPFYKLHTPALDRYCNMLSAYYVVVILSEAIDLSHCAACRMHRTVG